MYIILNEIMIDFDILKTKKSLLTYRNIFIFQMLKIFYSFSLSLAELAIWWASFLWPEAEITEEELVFSFNVD